ncbi:ATP-binding cassette domain-containing protein [Streptomyces stramineus]
MTALTCAAPAGVAAPEPVSFEVRPGQLVAITGDIGSGKSTLIRSLLALQPDVRGRVCWNGVDVTGDQDWLSAPRVGHARQQSLFLRGTVRDNLLLGTTGITAEHLERVMAAVHLRPGSPELPDGLDTHLDSGAVGRSPAASASGWHWPACSADPRNCTSSTTATRPWTARRPVPSGRHSPGSGPVRGSSCRTIRTC